MANDALLIDEIEVTVAGFFTTHHDLRTTMGSLGTLTLRGARSKGVFQAADGTEWTVERTSFWKGIHELRERGVVLGMAHMRGFFRRKIVVSFANREYALTPSNAWRRSWQLADETGVVYLELRPRGGFRRGAYLTVLAEIDMPLLVFAYYMIHNQWQSEQAAASTAATSS